MTHPCMVRWWMFPATTKQPQPPPSAPQVPVDLGVGNLQGPSRRLNSRLPIAIPNT